MATRDTVKSGAELARQHTRLQARKHNERHWSEGIESDDRYGEDLEVVRPRTKRVEQRPPRPAWWYRWLVG